MRHKIKGRKLNRTSSHRKALLTNLSTALLQNGVIKTTLPKAKELRPFVEKLMTLSKVDNLANRRKVLSVINDKAVVAKLFSEIATSIKDRNGGYTRIMQCGFRLGDKAPMAIIELVDRKIPTEGDKKSKDSDIAVKKTASKSSQKKSSDKKVEEKPAEEKKEAKAESKVSKKSEKKEKKEVKKDDVEASKEAPKSKK